MISRTFVLRLLVAVVSLASPWTILVHGLLHYSYAAEKDFFICRPHVKSLTNILGEENVQVLEMPVVGHFESHFSLADPTCEWHDAFRKTVSSL